MNRQPARLYRRDFSCPTRHCAIAAYTGHFYAPIHRRPSRFAASNVDPNPAKMSSTTSPVPRLRFPRLHFAVSLPRVVGMAFDKGLVKGRVVLSDKTSIAEATKVNPDLRGGIP
jgi:hypothetical protein